MKRFALMCGLAGLVLTGCEGRITQSDPPQPGVDDLLRQSLGTWGVVPIGQMPAQDPALAALGRVLFFDKVLSGNRDISCATCHEPAAALTDRRSLPIGTGAVTHGSDRTLGAGRKFVFRQSPTLLNSGIGMPYVFWDGRLNRLGGIGTNIRLESDPLTTPILPGNLPNTLVAQAMLPVLNRSEMRGEVGDRDVFGQTNELAAFTDKDALGVWNAIMQRLMAIPEYVDLFKAAFPTRNSGIFLFEDAARALAAFQMQEFTKTRSAFDRYLERDNGALTAEQKRGGTLFFNRARCSSCHNGPFLGGRDFANVGIPQIGPGSTRTPPLDIGRGELQQSEHYKFAFRVAPLRNVELTAPYMHNGAYATLENVINHYNNVTVAIRTYDPSQLTADVRAWYHGDQTTINDVLSTLDPRLRQPINLTEDEKRDLLAFLKALTDPSARNLTALTPLRVPSGLPVQ
jgi:cytochrome c peroxidase